MKLFAGNCGHRLKATKERHNNEFQIMESKRMRALIARGSSNTMNKGGTTSNSSFMDVLLVF